MASIRALWCFVCLSVATGAGAAQVAVERLEPGTPSDFQSVAALDRGWTPAPDALRRQAAPSWWRIRIRGAAPSGEPWVIAVREAYDARLVVHVPPDYRPMPMSTFDPGLRQPGSRHRLAIPVPAQALDQPVFVRLDSARGQPLRIHAQPLQRYLADDLDRVRFTITVAAAMALLCLVAIVYAIALRRWLLLLLCAWVAGSTVYVLGMSGELVALARHPWVADHAMAITLTAVNLGTVAAYAFVVGFLALPRHAPRLAVALRGLVAVLALVSLWVLLSPGSALGLTLLNLSVLALAVIALGAAALRARAGSPEGWWFLLGWGVVTVVGMTRAFAFLRGEGTAPWVEYAHPAALAFGALVLVLATARAARYAEREMHVARRAAGTDALTRLANRRHLDEGLLDRLAHARASGSALSVLFVDLDHFKAVNDRFGHDVGDACLMRLSALLRSLVRPTDLVARYGGEEFVAVLEGVDRERAKAIAEALRALVRAECASVSGQPVGLTVSVGVASLQPEEGAVELLRRADAALYEAKRGGRDRVVVYAGAEAAAPG